ncbi:UDP-glycosyltransferase 74F2 [Triticum urartu]|uniref:UDP-glycosyltransferase 74F2 n=1 Tax=Triticum urartu TaxID=4572 RepID=M7ZTZ9_TRIUA|nr:UDP-glycosyltransferase 74F2 [Triticum urartu]
MEEQGTAAGSETLGELLDAEAAEGRPVRAVVYDAFLPWARGVAQRHGAAAVAFFTQPCAVNVVYGHVWCERVGVPVEAGSTVVGLPGLPALEPEGLPWFLKVGPGPYPGYFEMVMSQFKGLELADDVLVNSFYELEPEGGSSDRNIAAFVAKLPVMVLVFFHLQEIIMYTIGQEEAVEEVECPDSPEEEAEASSSEG